MTDNELQQLAMSRARLADALKERAKVMTGRLVTPPAADAVRSRWWFGGPLSVALVVLAVLILPMGQGELPGDADAPAMTQEELAPLPGLANRTSCAEIGTSDLQLPSEGVWFLSNCIAIPELPLLGLTTNCNRASVDVAGFTAVSPGLYVFQQTSSSPAFLWSSSADNCFDLVSARTVTAVCVDQSVSFSWKASACSAQGGVLIRMNGR